MITTVFFDVGGTLVHPDCSRLLAPLLEVAQPRAEHLAVADRAAKRSPLQEEDDSRSQETTALGAHAGPVNKGHWQVFFETLLREMGCGMGLLSTLTARAAVSDYWSVVDPATASVLERLRQTFRLAVISNADGKIVRVLERAGLLPYFEVVVDSGLVGFEKPDQRIFAHALRQMNALAAKSLYVGDVHMIDYCGARNAGMQSLLLDPNGVYADWQVARIGSLVELPKWLESRE